MSVKDFETEAAALQSQADFYRTTTPIIPARTDFNQHPAEYYSQFSLEELEADVYGESTAPNDTTEFRNWGARQKAKSSVYFGNKEDKATAEKQVKKLQKDDSEITSETNETEAPVKHRSGMLLLTFGFVAFIIAGGNFTNPVFAFLLIGFAFFSCFKVLASKNFGNKFTHFLAIIGVINTSIMTICLSAAVVTAKMLGAW